MEEKKDQGHEHHQAAKAHLVRLMQMGYHGPKAATTVGRGDQPIDCLPLGARCAGTERSCAPRWETWAFHETARSYASMAVGSLPRQSTDAQSRGASSTARTV